MNVWRFALPYPPSLNRYYRNVRGMVLISKDGRLYRKKIKSVVAESGLPKVEGRLYVELTVSPPDRRRRDLDNILKAMLDALQHAGAYDDDSQIDYLIVRRAPVKKPGGIGVIIMSYEGGLEP